MHGGDPGVAVAEARKLLGRPYAWAQPVSASNANPRAMDCSGLTMVCYYAAGVRPALPHYSGAQYATLRHRPLAQAEPGDLVFFRSGASIYHVAIYVGGGQIIEAPDYGIPVRYRAIDSTTPDIMPNVGIFPASVRTGGTVVQTPTGSESVLTVQQIALVARNAGFTGVNLPIAVAVCLAESGGRPNATNNNSDGSVDRGLWQINSVHQDLPGYDQWEDPQTNARLAYLVWTSQGWHGWTTYNSGAYEQFLPQGRTAAGQASPPVPPMSLHIPLNVTTRRQVVSYIEAGAVNGDVQPSGFAMALITGTDWMTYKGDPHKLQADYSSYLSSASHPAWDAAAIHAYKEYAKGNTMVPAGYQGDVQKVRHPANWEADIVAGFDRITSRSFWERAGILLLGVVVAAASVYMLVRDEVPSIKLPKVPE